MGAGMGTAAGVGVGGSALAGGTPAAAQSVPPAAGAAPATGFTSSVFVTSAAATATAATIASGGVAAPAAASGTAAAVDPAAALGSGGAAAAAAAAATAGAGFLGQEFTEEMLANLTRGMSGLEASTLVVEPVTFPPTEEGYLSQVWRVRRREAACWLVAGPLVVLHHQNPCAPHPSGRPVVPHAGALEHVPVYHGRDPGGAGGGLLRLLLGAAEAALPHRQVRSTRAHTSAICRLRHEVSASEEGTLTAIRVWYILRHTDVQGLRTKLTKPSYACERVHNTSSEHLLWAYGCRLGRRVDCMCKRRS